MQLIRQRRCGHEAVVHRGHADAVSGERGEPLPGTVRLVAAEPAAAVEVNDEWRVLLRSPVEVQPEGDVTVNRRVDVIALDGDRAQGLLPLRSRLGLDDGAAWQGLISGSSPVGPPASRREC
jgi:hypothetical protein